MEIIQNWDEVLQEFESRFLWKFFKIQIRIYEKFLKSRLLGNYS